MGGNLLECLRNVAPERGAAIAVIYLSAKCLPYVSLETVWELYNIKVLEINHSGLKCLSAIFRASQFLNSNTGFVYFTKMAISDVEYAINRAKLCNGCPTVYHIYMYLQSAAQ